MTRLLMMSVGSLVGQNLLDVLEVRADAIRVVGTTSVAMIPLQRCERVYLVPSTERPPSAFVQRLLAIIEREQPDLVIPTRDRDVTVLAELAAVDSGLAARTPCGRPDIATVLEDKWLSYLFARAHALPFAESAVSDVASRHRAVYQLAAKVGFPLMAKPRFGFGSRDVLLLTDAEQLEAALVDDGFVVQRYIGPAEPVEIFRREVPRRGVPLFYSLEQDKYSIQTYINRDGAVTPVYCTLHRMEKGFSVGVERIRNARLMALGERWAGALATAGWRGPLNIQCQRDEGDDFVVFELNGRFTGATAARYYLGHDELGYLLADRLGQTPVPGPVSGPAQPVKYHRTLGVSLADAKVLEQRGVWEKQTASRQMIETTNHSQGDKTWARYPLV